jgi:hypothetical protein
MLVDNSQRLPNGELELSLGILHCCYINREPLRYQTPSTPVSLQESC